MDEQKEHIAQQLTEKLETKRELIQPGDFRFYNIGRIPLLCKHTLNNAEICDQCKDNIGELEKIIDSLPECLENRDGRKTFEKEKETITKHLEKKHYIRLANYHYSLFTFAGLLVGAGLGLLIQITYQQRLWPIFAIIGAAIGAWLGKNYERRKNRENKLM